LKFFEHRQLILQIKLVQVAHCHLHLIDEVNHVHDVFVELSDSHAFFFLRRGFNRFNDASYCSFGDFCDLAAVKFGNL
jgi:hypothetical protein